MESHPCQAAVITPAGAAAIGSILLCGAGAEEILRSVFRRHSPTGVSFEPGQVFVGWVMDGNEAIDQVVIGCEGRQRFAIHGHGNPLLVESILEILVRHGAKPVSAETMIQSQIAADESDTIAAEAEIERLKAVTIEGFRLISSQIEGGLSRWAKEWIGRKDAISIPEIREQCKRILADSRIAKRIIHGCRAAIIGPPNSGKSALFNRLCGSDKSIVADIGGTTRDWVSAVWRIPSLRVELIDTAGLADDLASTDSLQAASQQRTREMICAADILIVVLDGSRPLMNFAPPVAEVRPVIVVMNKSDLPQSLDPKTLPFPFAESVTLSAQTGHGVDNLPSAIRRATGVEGFDLDHPVCSTPRQNAILTKLAECSDSGRAVVFLEQLLKNSPPL